MAPPRALLFAGILVVASALLACSGGSEGGIDILTPSPTSESASPETPSASPTNDEPAPARPEFATVVPDWIDGLDTETESNQGEPYNYFATWPAIEDYPLLGDSVSASIDEMRESFEERVSPPLAGAPWIQELNVTFDFLVASGDVIGVRLQRYEFLGAGGANFAHTIWFDTEAGQPLPATALLEDDSALDEVVRLVREDLSAHPDLGGDVLRSGTEPTVANYDSIGFTAAGDLLIEFDEYQVGPGSSGSPRVVIPYEMAEPLLSDFGQRARQEVLAPDEELRLESPTPPASPTVSPTPSAEASPPAEGAVDCEQADCVALTFDDGPAQETARLLDILKARDVVATFFVVGTNAQYGPELLARMAAEGHEIGNHTTTHRDLTQLSAEQIHDQIEETAAAVEAAGAPRPRLLRPPYGAVDERVASEVGMPLILWSVDPRDWADHDPALIAERVREQVKPGSIVLLHDIHETTVDAVPAILDDLKARGLVPVTVSDLFASRLEAGQTYRSR